jgi:hypothetical protein
VKSEKFWGAAEQRDLIGLYMVNGERQNSEKFLGAFGADLI